MFETSARPPDRCAPMTHRLLARRLVLASLDVAIRKARRELRWCRLVLKLGAALGRDMTSAAIVLRRAERRLDCCWPTAGARRSKPAAG